jgi:hypothetical protein
MHLLARLWIYSIFVKYDKQYQQGKAAFKVLALYLVKDLLFATCSISSHKIFDLESFD